MCTNLILQYDIVYDIVYIGYPIGYYGPPGCYVVYDIVLHISYAVI